MKVECVSELTKALNKRSHHLSLRDQNLKGGIPPTSGGFELDDLESPFQPKPFYGSVIILLHCVQGTCTIAANF